MSVNVEFNLIAPSSRTAIKHTAAAFIYTVNVRSRCELAVLALGNARSSPPETA